MTNKASRSSPQSLYKPEKGLSLIEILFALAVIAAMLIVSAGIFQKTSIKSNATRIRDSVQILMSSLGEYYSDNCANLSYGTNGNVINLTGSNDALYDPNSNKNYLDNLTIISNPLNSNGANSYQMNIMWQVDNSQARWTFNIQTSLNEVNDNDLLDTYINLINPSIYDGQTVVWMQTPASIYSPLKTSFNQFSISESNGAGPNNSTDPCASLNAQHATQGTGSGSAYD